MSNKIVQRLGNKMVQKLINARRVLLGKGKIYGNAANKSLAKALRSNMMGEGVMFVVFSVPDTYRVITGKISGAQYTKNMLSAMASIVGTWAGTNGSGLVAGRIFEKLGKKIDKKFGAVIGFAAAASGGIIFGYAVNKLTGLFKEDDCIITARLFNSVIVNMAVEYFMDDKEIDILIKELDDDSKKIGKFQIKLRNSKHQYYDTQKFLEPYFERAISNRKKITETDEKNIFTVDQNDLKGMEE